MINHEYRDYIRWANHQIGLAADFTNEKHITTGALKLAKVFIDKALEEIRKEELLLEKISEEEWQI